MVRSALDLDQTSRRLGRDAAETPVADDVLLLDNVVAGGAKVSRLDAQYNAIVEWSGVIRVERRWLRHVESDAVTKTTEPNSTGRQVQRRTDRATKTARGGDSIEPQCRIESTGRASVVIALGRRGSAGGVHATVIGPIPVEHDAAVDEEHLALLPTSFGRVAEQTALDTGDDHRVTETVRAVSKTRGGEDVVDVTLAHPRSQRGLEVREGAVEDVARSAHPLDFPGALAQTRRPDLLGRVEPPDACRQKVDDTGRRRVHCVKRVDPNRVRIT